MAVFHTGRRWRSCVVFAHCEQKPVFVGEGEKKLTVGGLYELWIRAGWDFCMCLSVSLILRRTSFKILHPQAKTLFGEFLN